jgi:hypothetical protein
MTNEEVFNILQLAEDMSHKNWMHFRFLYNNKFKEAEDRIKELEAALREAREDILLRHNARGSEAAGTDEEAVSFIDAALAGEKTND